jgi:predicted N-acetyltransferase YhbS
VVVRPLAEGDDRTQFRSTSPELERFFRQYASQSQFKQHIGVTYVAVADDRAIVGYVTVAAGSMEAEKLPTDLKKRLPRYPLPILRLARLAVHADAQRQGIGEALVRYVFDLALGQMEKLGCAGVVVDSKPESRPYWDRWGFIPLEAVEGQADARPQPIPMFLAVSALQAARTIQSRR